jgi:hypothetical protein
VIEKRRLYLVFARCISLSHRQVAATQASPSSKKHEADSPQPS